MITIVVRRGATRSTALSQEKGLRRIHKAGKDHELVMHRQLNFVPFIAKLKYYLLTSVNLLAFVPRKISTPLTSILRFLVYKP